MKISSKVLLASAVIAVIAWLFYQNDCDNINAGGKAGFASGFQDDLADIIWPYLQKSEASAKMDELNDLMAQDLSIGNVIKIAKIFRVSNPTGIAFLLNKKYPDTFCHLSDNFDNEDLRKSLHVIEDIEHLAPNIRLWGQKAVEASKDCSPSSEEVSLRSIFPKAESTEDADLVLGAIIHNLVKMAEFVRIADYKKISIFLAHLKMAVSMLIKSDPAKINDLLRMYNYCEKLEDLGEFMTDFGKMLEGAEAWFEQFLGTIPSCE